MREYHTAWLQLLEQGQATCMDERERIELQRLMVWSKPSLSSRVSNPLSTQSVSAGSQPPLPYANQGRVGRNNYVFQVSKPGDKACLTFNRGSCQTPATHPSDPHICAYCLWVAQRSCCHPESRCNCKKWGRGSLKSPASPPFLQMDKCDMDIPPPAVSLSLIPCPPTPPVCAIRLAPVAVTASGVLRGAGPCAQAPFLPSTQPTWLSRSSCQGSNPLCSSRHFVPGRGTAHSHLLH